jgi:hypothetical protein
MNKFKGLLVQGQKYIKGKKQWEYCMSVPRNRTNKPNPKKYKCYENNSSNCHNCLFNRGTNGIFDKGSRREFKEWVKSNEASINWKPKEDREFPNIDIGNTAFKFRTDKLRVNALNEIRKLLATLPKG